MSAKASSIRISVNSSEPTVTAARRTFQKGFNETLSIAEWEAIPLEQRLQMRANVNLCVEYSDARGRLLTNAEIRQHHSQELAPPEPTQRYVIPVVKTQ